MNGQSTTDRAEPPAPKRKKRRRLQSAGDIDRALKRKYGAPKPPAFGYKLVLRNLGLL